MKWLGFIIPFVSFVILFDSFPALGAAKKIGLPVYIKRDRYYSDAAELRRLYWKNGDRVYEGACPSTVSAEDASPENCPTIFSVPISSFLEAIPCEKSSDFCYHPTDELEKARKKIENDTAALGKQSHRIAKIAAIDAEAAELLKKKILEYQGIDIDWDKKHLQQLLDKNAHFLKVLEQERSDDFTGKPEGDVSPVSDFLVSKMFQLAQNEKSGIAVRIRRIAPRYRDFHGNQWTLLSEEARIDTNNPGSMESVSFGPPPENEDYTAYKVRGGDGKIYDGGYDVKDKLYSCEKIFGANWHLPSAKQILLNRSELKASKLGQITQGLPFWTRETGHCGFMEFSPCSKYVVINMRRTVGGWWAVTKKGYEGKGALRVCVCNRGRECRN